MIEEAGKHGPNGARHLHRDIVEARGKPSAMASDETEIEGLTAPAVPRLRAERMMYRRAAIGKDGESGSIRSTASPR